MTKLHQTANRGTVPETTTMDAVCMALYFALIIYGLFFHI